jgi:medium-chain acyl-[acyl-carrier-protein] hydrolase
MLKPASPSEWIVRKPRPRARLRLFCFPYAGGGAAAFRTWADLAPDLDICAVQAPGRETRMRDAPFYRIEPLVEAATDAIRPLLDQPFAFFGHSVGAFVAFEVARRLRRENAPLPGHLFMAGCPAPQKHVVDRPIHDFPDDELKEELRRYKGTPDEVLQHGELMNLLLPLLRADFSVYETYSPAPDAPFDIPMSALGGLEDEDATRDELDAWREHTTKSFVLRMFPGNHFFLHSARTKLLGSVLQDLGRLLGR